MPARPTVQNQALAQKRVEKHEPRSEHDLSPQAVLEPKPAWVRCQQFRNFQNGITILGLKPVRQGLPVVMINEGSQRPRACRSKTARGGYRDPRNCRP